MRYSKRCTDVCMTNDNTITTRFIPDPHYTVEVVRVCNSQCDFTTGQITVGEPTREYHISYTTIIDDGEEERDRKEYERLKKKFEV